MNIVQHYKVEISICERSLIAVCLEGVQIQLNSQIPCQLRAFWFVNIQRFYSELDAPDFRLALYEKRFLENDSIHQELFE